VLTEAIRHEARVHGQRAADASALVEAPAQGRFCTQDPSAPLPLCAGVEAEDAIAVTGREIRIARESGCRSDQEGAIDIIPSRADVEAEIGPRP
jgi:hypothetical protein